MGFFTKQIKRSGQVMPGQGRLAALCLVLFFLSLLVGVVSGFPSEVLRKRMVQEIARQTGLAVSSTTMELGLPAEVRFDLTVDPDHPQLAPLVFSQLQLRPVWTSLVSGPRTASLQGRFADGKIAATFSSEDQLRLDLQGIQLAPLQKTGNPYHLDGVLRGELEGRQISQAGSADALFSAEISNLVVFGLDPLALPERLMLGQLALQGRLRGQRLNLENVALAGDFAGVTGNGTIQLGANPERTRLNLRITATPGRAFPEELKPLIELSGVKPAADGSYRFRIAGTLARPLFR
jgi:type II secretion system protein N